MGRKDFFWSFFNEKNFLVMVKPGWIILTASWFNSLAPSLKTLMYIVLSTLHVPTVKSCLDLFQNIMNITHSTEVCSTDVTCTYMCMSHLCGIWLQNISNPVQCFPCQLNTGNSICCYLKLNPAYAQLRSLIIIDLKKANKSKFRL